MKSNNKDWLVLIRQGVTTTTLIISEFVDAVIPTNQPELIIVPYVAGVLLKWTIIVRGLTTAWELAITSTFYFFYFIPSYPVRTAQHCLL
jgi:prepilin signal peptidase PulO-like enzyme (type II secretory pathway)